jgi:catalase
VGPKLGPIGDIDVEITLETGPSVLFDAVVIPGGEAAAALAALGPALEFIKDQYRHCKPILALGSGADLLEAAGIPRSLPNGDDDPGLLHAVDVDEVAADFIAAIAKHRHLERFSDPPRV